MADIYNKELIKERPFGEKTIKTYMVTRNEEKGKDMSIYELKRIANNLIGKYGAENVSIVARNVVGRYTLKTYAAEHINVEEYEDYYENKVANTGKFEKFHQLEISIRN